MKSRSLNETKPCYEDVVLKSASYQFSLLVLQYKPSVFDSRCTQEEGMW